MRHFIILRIKGKMIARRFFWDVSGFVRLFYILSKNKIFRIFGRQILVFWPIISRFSWSYRTFSVKKYFSSKSRISAQNRIRPWQWKRFHTIACSQSTGTSHVRWTIIDSEWCETSNEVLIFHINHHGRRFVWQAISSLRVESNKDRTRRTKIKTTNKQQQV